MKKIPEFEFKSPNIHPVPEAVWTHRTRLPGKDWDEPVARTDVPKVVIRTVPGDGRSAGCRGGLIAEYRPPANVGTAFYTTLRKLGYKKNTEGNYAQA